MNNGVNDGGRLILSDQQPDIKVTNIEPKEAIIFKKRIIYIDILRVIAMIAVVTIHISGSLLYQFNSASPRLWWIGNIYDSMSRWSVPIFVMISGVVILQDVRKRTIFKFLRRQVPKVLIPLIFWSFFYGLWVVRTNYHIFSFKTTLMNLLRGNAYYHLWFLFMILGLYLMVPILKVFVQNSGDNNILYFLILWFIISSLMGLLNKFSGFRTMLNLPFMTGYIGYFVLGCYLAKTKFSKSLTFVLYLLALAGIAVTIIGTYMLTVKNNGLYDGYFYDYLSPNVVITSIGIFLFIKNSCAKVAHFNKKFTKLVSHLSKIVFGIYLVHILVIDVLATNMLGFRLNYMTYNPIISIPLTDCIVLLLSYVIVRILNKIPLVKAIVP